LVNSHSDDIIDLINKEHGCSEIASAICSLYRYPDKLITGHQISNWIGYQRKMGYLATPFVTGDKINANWCDNCMFQEWLFNTTGKDNAAISLAQKQLEESEEPKEPPTEDFGNEFQNRLKHLSIWFDAVHEDTYHLFLKKLPDTDPILHVQSPSSIFVVWATKPPSNELLQQVSKLSYGYLQVIATTASTTFTPPFPVKVSSSEWEKKILNDNIGQPVWVQYIFQKKESKIEVVDKAFEMKQQ
jgi:hypothetical protein